MFQNFESAMQLFDVWTDRYATIVISLYFGTLQNETCTYMRGLICHCDFVRFQVSLGVGCIMTY